MKVSKAVSISGEIDLPGDKSISHRAAMFAALADGTSVISNYATSVDCGSTINCLRQLGVTIRQDGSTMIVEGVGRNGFTAPSGSLDCGNSGTTMRLLSGILAGQDFESVMIGDESLSVRPMKRVLIPLTAMGANVDSVDGHAPITIRGGQIDAIEYTPPVASAQIKSCVLLAGLNANGKTTVVEHSATRDHTERMLRWFGADVEQEGPQISLTGPCDLRSRDLTVPGDASSAAFFMVAAACLDGSHLTIKNVGLNPTRIGFVRVMSELGVDMTIEDERISCNEPVGSITIRGQRERLESSANVIEGPIIANLIDELPVLAVLGTKLEGGIEVRGAAELRVKESDRIAAVVQNLRLMGAAAEEFRDGFRIERSDLNGAAVKSYGDHRIAMAFAVAGLLAEGETTIEGAECADVSFPAFFPTLSNIVSS